jgi:hypothetical protein
MYFTCSIFKIILNEPSIFYMGIVRFKLQNVNNIFEVKALPLNTLDTFSKTSKLCRLNV